MSTDPGTLTLDQLQVVLDVGSFAGPREGLAARHRSSAIRSATRRPIGDSRRPFEFDMLQNRHAYHV